MKNIFKQFGIVIAITLVIYITVYLVSLKFHKPNYTKDEDQQDECKVHIIKNLRNPRQISWKDKNNLLITVKQSSTDEINTFLYQYNINERKTNKLQTLENNELFGLENDKLLFCTWQNYQIKKANEIATKIKIKNIHNQVLKKITTSETITPISCSTQKLYAITPPILEEKYYQYSHHEDNFTEIKKSKVPTKLIYNNATVSTHISEKLNCISKHSNYIYTQDITKYIPNQHYKKHQVIVDNDGLIMVTKNCCN